MMSALRIAAFGVAIVCATLAVLGSAAGPAARHIVFAAPLALSLALVPLIALCVRAWVWPGPATMRFSRTRDVAQMGRGLAGHLAELPDGTRLASALLMVLALARPQSERMTDHIEHQGIDIAIALDLSDSMEANDLRPNRLEAAKAVIDDFIERRPRDRIAIVAFGATASTVAPLTLDHDVVRALVARLRLGVIDGSMTAIGAGLGVALNRLSESEATSRVIVLLTDGVHNADGVDPETVTQEAKERGVRIYTVLVGRHELIGNVASVDPAALERIADATGGVAYAAQDGDALQVSFQDLLDQLERSTITSEPIRAELFWWFLWPALLLLLGEAILRNTRLRRFP